jgi:hypothetical protein
VQCLIKVLMCFLFPFSMNFYDYHNNTINCNHLLEIKHLHLRPFIFKCLTINLCSVGTDYTLAGYSNFRCWLLPLNKILQLMITENSWQQQQHYRYMLLSSIDITCYGWTGGKLHYRCYGQVIIWIEHYVFCNKGNK